MDRALDETAPETRIETVPVVAVFDMFGTIHQIPGICLDRPTRAPREEAAAPFSFAPAARTLRRWMAGAAMLVLGIAGGFTPGSAWAQTLLNVSYDPTRELYKAYDAAFNAHWQAEGHPALEIKTSHGGSGAQARSVIDGLDA